MPTDLEGDYRPWTDLPILSSLFTTLGVSGALWGLIIDHRVYNGLSTSSQQTELKAISRPNVLVTHALNSPIK